MNRFYE